MWFRFRSRSLHRAFTCPGRCLGNLWDRKDAVFVAILILADWEYWGKRGLFEFLIRRVAKFYWVSIMRDILSIFVSHVLSRVHEWSLLVVCVVGVPQRSNLGPLLLFTFVKDLPPIRVSSLIYNLVRLFVIVDEFIYNLHNTLQCTNFYLQLIFLNILLRREICWIQKRWRATHNDGREKTSLCSHFTNFRNFGAVRITGKYPVTVINNLLEKFNKPASVRPRINIDVLAQHPIFFIHRREKNVWSRGIFMSDNWHGCMNCTGATRSDECRTIVVRPPFAVNKRRAQYQSINQRPMDKSNGTVCESCEASFPYYIIFVSPKMQPVVCHPLIDGIALYWRIHWLLPLLWVLIRNK